MPCTPEQLGMLTAVRPDDSIEAHGGGEGALVTPAALQPSSRWMRWSSAHQTCQLGRLHDLRHGEAVRGLLRGRQLRAGWLALLHARVVS